MTDSSAALAAGGAASAFAKVDVTAACSDTPVGSDIDQLADDRQAVLAASRALADETNTERLLVLVAETAVRLCDADGACLLMRDADVGWSRAVVVEGDRSWRVPPRRLDDDAGDAAQARLLRHAVACTAAGIVDDLPCDEVRGSANDRARASGLVLPFAAADDARAVLVLSKGPARPAFGPRELHRLERIAGQFEVSLRHVATRRLMQRRAREVAWERRVSACALQLRERALDALTQGVMIVERRDGATPRVLYVNRRFVEDSGYTLADMQDGGPGLLNGDDTGQPALADLLHAVHTDTAGHALLRNYRKTGELFWSETSVAPVQPGVQVSLHTDVTARIEADQRRRASDERLRSVFDLGPDGFVVLDDRRRVLRVNAAFEAMTGLSEAALAGIDIDGFERRLAARCRQPRPDQPADVLRVDSKPPVVLWRRERRSAGRGLETVMFFRDITPDVESDRLKNEFITAAAHELRTPLTSVFGFTELLLARPALSVAESADMAATVHRQSDLLTRLVDEVQELARIEAGGADGLDLRLQPLQPLVMQAARQASGSSRLERLQVRLPLQPIWMRLDEHAIVRALAHALSNALRFSGDQPVVVSLDRPPGTGRLGLRVKDTGCGMSAAELGRLFERFFRADAVEPSGGTGLGATVMKAIVELHGGQVTATSTPGAGTEVTFWLDLPSGFEASTPPCR